MTKKLAVLISNQGKGTNLQAIINAIKNKKIKAKIKVVISDEENAPGLIHVKKNKIKIEINKDKKKLLALLKKHEPDFIFLTGWKQIIENSVIEAFPNKILNTHPGIIPDSINGFFRNPDETKGLWNKGKLTEKAIQNVINNNATYAGCSNHFLTKDFDFGPVLGRCFEKVRPNDTINSLYARLKKKENKMYVTVLSKLCEDNTVILNEVKDPNDKKNKLMKILILGSGGREHALAESYAKSKKVKRVFVAPGNDLMNFKNKKIEIFPYVKPTDFEAILGIAKKNNVDLVDVAQDDFLALGFVDKFKENGIEAFGANKIAAEIEWSKDWARSFMKKCKLPIPFFKSFNNQIKAISYINSSPERILYIKASGLAAGKGAIRAENKKEAIKAIKTMENFGKSGETFLIEECLVGEEFSVFAICDGKNYKIAKCAQDHKTVFEKDKGPNTGGMGCVASCLVANKKVIKEVEEKILNPFLLGMTKEKRPFAGILYIGGMLTNPPDGGGVKIIEFNARWGDPEAEVILPSIKTDYLDFMLATIAGKLNKIKVNFDNKTRISVAGCSLGYPEDYSNVKGKEILGLEKAMKIPGIKIFGAGIKRKGSRFYANGGRIFHLVAEGNNILGARKKAYTAMALISIEGNNLHYRKDIGWKDVERMRNPERNSEQNEVEGIQKIRVKTKGSNIIKVYRLEGIDLKEAKILAEKLLSESINQEYKINKPFVLPNYQTIEIAYKPGVMNPEVSSILKAASDLGIKLKAADSSCEYFFNQKITREDIEKLKLYNPLTERIVEEEPTTLLIEGKTGKTQTIKIRDLNNEQLLELSKDKLFLNLLEMKTIQKYYQKMRKDPTDLELETLAQTWSEHSGHKTFKADLIVNGKKKKPLMERVKKEALKHSKNIVSAFSDNSGVMDFYDGWAISGKGETHNAPSAIEPYGGAMTGSGGVFRDIAATGQGAKNVISTDIFCFASPKLSEKDLPVGTLPPSYLLKRVVEGVRDYGNRVGIPTCNGSIHFHPDFRAKPTVFVGAYGIMPKIFAKKGTPKLSDLIIVLGGKTGRDGIHGATFSSGEMTERTINVNATAVQIGNAIEEKRMLDALLEARDAKIIQAVQDCGGGGLSSSIGEIGEKLGVTINLEKAPLKYHGLAPWEIWVSESQERIIVVIAPRDLKKLLSICKKYNVEAAVLGKFDGSRKLNVFFGKEKVGDLDMKFLHQGLPKRVLQAKRKFKIENLKFKIPDIPKGEQEWIKVLNKVLSHGNVCSKEPIVRMYDHNVQGTSVLPPFTGVKENGPSDAVVIRPLLDKNYGMIVSHGLNPVLNNIDPYWGTIWAAAEAVSNYTAVGGDIKNASLIENFIWPFPDSESLWSLDASVDAVVDFMNTFKIPVISGKDSLSSTYRSSTGEVIKIPPVFIMSVFGKIPDASKTVSSDFKKAGSVIVLLGKQDLESLGGSIYFDVNGILGNNIPKVDLKLLFKVLKALHLAIKNGKVLSAHDISEGGVITSIFEMCLGGQLGVSIDIANKKADDFLFNETAGTFIVEVENEETAKKLFKGLPFTILGETVNKKTIKVENKKEKLFEIEIDNLVNSWKKPMEEIFNYET